MPGGDYNPRLNYTVLNDFRPGIHSRLWHSGVAGSNVAAPLGAAQDSGTFRCVALPSGGLAPLPKIVGTFDIPLPDTDVNSEFGYFNVSGFFSFGPVATGTSPIDDNMFVGVEYLLAAGPNNRVFTYSRIDLVSGAPVIDTLASITTTSGQGSESYRGMTWGVTRMSVTGPDFTNPGNPEVITSWGPPGGAPFHVWAFPNPAVPTTSVVVDLAGPNRPIPVGGSNFGEIICHQGRVVLLEFGVYPFGSHAGDAIPTNEQISFSDPANSYNAFGGGTPYTIGTQASIFGAELPNGYGAMGSQSSSELLLIKHQGGAVAVFGDLNSPTVYRYPGVRSTGGYGTRMGNTSEGLMYYSRFDGVYLWNGSSSSQLISGQMENDFLFYPALQPMLTFQFQFERWGEWVVGTNGYLYDTISHGWWRLDDPASYTPQWFSRGFFGEDLYVVPLRATNAAGPGSKVGFIRRYNLLSPSSNYSWNSQYLPVSQDRTIEIRDLVLLAQGVGTVKVIATALDGGTSTETFTLTKGSAPQRLRPDTTTAGATAVNGYNISVRIVSTGHSGGAAPRVDSLAIGWRDSVRAVSV